MSTQQPRYKPHDEQQFNKLVSNAVLDGWTVRLLPDHTLEMTKSKSKMKQQASFDGNKYVSKLLK